ncbi:MFS general substrate transporter [Delitschia confertaspora ATCC 74209]|uniref:MFS general substrate transporter n=1 Tax=Delitschia confertaspora ATCC 74209 TaxID=1513339 RepID=A0A9P4JK75_9PLEO|nr:MFS general substrate transporter [Delitschia confertaspora ATCC 74209]
MFLTKPRTPRDPEKFPIAQLFLLALVRVAEPIALTSIFPYAWKLVLHYHVTSEANAAFFAGILISAFSLAEACTGMAWGGLSDRVGRKPVLLFGCFGTMISLLVVGFAPNFWVALLGRILGGVLNGNIGVVQTMVGELVTKPEHEPKAFSVMPFVWSIGTIIGPSIGGYFADPAENFPRMFSPTGIFERFPYLLPNLICAALLVGAIIAGILFIDETHPDMQSWSTPEDLKNTSAETPLLPSAGATAHCPANLRDESYGTFNSVDVHNDEVWHVRSDGASVESDTPSEKILTKQVVMFVAALGIFTYHSMTYDHLLPIYFQDKRVEDISAFTKIKPSAFAGGLGLSTQEVGIIMSVNGLIALFIQAVVFPLSADRFGVWNLTIFVTIGHPISYFIVPYLAIVPESWLYPAIYLALIIRELFSILAYPLLLILVKEAAPSPNHLGRINGLAASVGAAARTVASPIAGLLYGIGTEIRFTPLAWWVSTLVAIIGALQVPFLRRQKKNTSMQVRPALATNPPTTDVVRINIEDDGVVSSNEAERV